jgi:hypothetical protein
MRPVAQRRVVLSGADSSREVELDACAHSRSALSVDSSSTVGLMFSDSHLAKS